MIPLSKTVLVATSLLLVTLSVAQSETDRMVERLKEIRGSYESSPHGYLGDQRTRQLKSQLKPNMGVPQTFQLQYEIAESQIHANRNHEALKTLNELDAFLLPILDSETKSQIYPTVDRLRALAWLRLGEQENCVQHHSSESCLFPINAGGYHSLKEGSQNAIQLYHQLLTENPDDHKSLWLMCIAAMTLNQYPDSIPQSLRLPESAFDSDFDISHFTDVSSVVGVDQMGLSGGGIVDDFNGDGFLDIAVSSWSLEDQIRIFTSDASSGFQDTTQLAGIEGITGGLNLLHADYDNDGDPDILVLRGAWLNKWGRQPNSLLRNDGHGSFSDVTESSGLLSYHPTQTAVWFDFNADGNLDLFIGNESNPYDRHPSELYRNNGDGTFTDVAKASGLTLDQWIKGVASGDFDNDGWPDLYVSILGGRNKLFRNLGKATDNGWGFQDVTDRAGVAEPIRSFPCWFWDYDNDGWEDIFVGGFNIENVGDAAAYYRGLPNQLETPRLYRNNRKGGFDEVAIPSGLNECWIPMGANFGDLDNDGFLDFYAGTGDTPLDSTLPNKMYRNNGGNGFQDVTTSGGFGHLQKGHAVSFADFDNDGDQDIHIVMGGAFSGDRYMNALFQNPGHGNSWLKLSFNGEQSNRNGLGVRLKLDVETPNGPRSIYRTVSTGGSFGSNPLRQEIGLGNATKIIRLSIHWPTSGTHQKFEFVRMNEAYLISESTTELAHLDRLRRIEISLPQKAKEHEHHR